MKDKIINKIRFHLAVISLSLLRSSCRHIVFNVAGGPVFVIKTHSVAFSLFTSHKASPSQHLDYSGSLWRNKGVSSALLNVDKGTISDVAEKPPSSRILTVSDEQWTHPSHNYCRTTTCHYFPTGEENLVAAACAYLSVLRNSVIVPQTLCLL